MRKKSFIENTTEPVENQNVNDITIAPGGRIQWLDIYKGLAILLVVIGHLEISDSLYKYIYMFHMYAFFFAAGITFKINKSETFIQFLKKNISRLYIPYLFFAFMWDVTNMLIQVTHGNHYDFSISALSQNFVAVLIGRGIIYSNASIGPAWFLLCLLVVRIIFWSILNNTSVKIYRTKKLNNGSRVTGSAI